jgi:hypothetical protein
MHIDWLLEYPFASKDTLLTWALTWGFVVMNFIFFET